MLIVTGKENIFFFSWIFFMNDLSFGDTINFFLWEDLKKLNGEQIYYCVRKHPPHHWKLNKIDIFVYSTSHVTL